MKSINPFRIEGKGGEEDIEDINHMQHIPFKHSQEIVKDCKYNIILVTLGLEIYDDIKILTRNYKLKVYKELFLNNDRV